jgi:hypothetical protein
MNNTKWYKTTNTSKEIKNGTMRLGNKRSDIYQIP